MNSNSELVNAVSAGAFTDFPESLPPATLGGVRDSRFVIAPARRRGETLPAHYGAIDDEFVANDLGRTSAEEELRLQFRSADISEIGGELATVIEPVALPVAPSRSWKFRLTASAPERETDFGDALADLEESPDEAREEGYAPPTETAMKNARRLLERMYALRSCRYEVYPTRDREMCIYIPEGRRSVLVTCDPDGGVHCSTSLEKGHSRTYYDRDYVADPPPSFLVETLAALDGA